MATLEENDEKTFSEIAILFLLGLGIAIWSMKKGTDRSNIRHSLEV
jgi:hypothetical protein